MTARLLTVTSAPSTDWVSPCAVAVKVMLPIVVAEAEALGAVNTPVNRL